MEFVLIFIITVGISFLFGFLAIEVLTLLAKIWGRKRSAILKSALIYKPAALVTCASIVPAALVTCANIVVSIPFWVIGSNTFFLHRLLVPIMTFAHSHEGVEPP